jgi:uncharacterized protein YjbI with pentapeptide repeats
MEREQYLAALRSSVAEFDELRKQDPNAKIDISGADLSGADLRGAPLLRVNLSNVNFEGADLTKANLSQADLRGARFNGARLVDIRLHQADMEGADFRGAVLGGFEADSQMCLRGCNFKGVQWSREQLEYFLDVLNMNDDWEIRYQLVPKGS